jgi:hypothetical protein
MWRRRSTPQGLSVPDTIGNIAVPEIAVSGTFPIIPEYPYGRANHPDVAIHQFGSPPSIRFTRIG